MTGEAELQLVVPDSITSWVTEAIGLSEEKGLGMAPRAELRTLKPFFVDFTLPYSVIRGEQTKVPLTVYNYLPTCAEVRARDVEVSFFLCDILLFNQYINLVSLTVTSNIKPCKKMYISF